MTVDPNAQHPLLCHPPERHLEEHRLRRHLEPAQCYSFTTDGSGASYQVGTDWLLIDKSSGTAGSATPVIYAAAATTANTKIYRTTNGGTTWSAMPANPPAPPSPPVAAPSPPTAPSCTSPTAPATSAQWRQ